MLHSKQAMLLEKKFSFFHSLHQNGPENKISSELKPPAPSQFLVFIRSGYLSPDMEEELSTAHHAEHCLWPQALVHRSREELPYRVLPGRKPGLSVPLCSCGIRDRILREGLKLQSPEADVEFSLPRCCIRVITWTDPSIHPGGSYCLYLSSEKMKVQKKEVAAKLRRSRARSVTKAPNSGRQHMCDASLSTVGAQWSLLGSLCPVL